ncbi:MAG: hypothetical protein EON52_06305, partial [Actinomycetales bacterium]
MKPPLVPGLSCVARHTRALVPTVPSPRRHDLGTNRQQSGPRLCARPKPAPRRSRRAAATPALSHAPPEGPFFGPHDKVPRALTDLRCGGTAAGPRSSSMTANPTLPVTPSGRAELRQPVLGLPDPGERVPGVAWPTVALYLGTLGLFGLEMAGLLAWDWSRWVTVPMGAAVTFLMFSVLHESIHHAASSRSWLNAVLGHASMPFVVAWATYPLVKFIHIEHHRNTNEPKAIDPDGWTHEGPAWQFPFRWATLDLWYVWFYATHLTSRPRRELMLTATVATAVLSSFGALVATGHGMTLVWAYLVPQRLGVVILAWWFDYLPHHGLTTTQREDKYRATRIRVGGEGLLTPLFVYQNYHLVHHLHPSVPFYSYVRAWRRNEEAYLDRNAAISTWFGRSLTASEYRTWRRLTDPLAGAAAGETRATFYPLRV